MHGSLCSFVAKCSDELLSVNEITPECSHKEHMLWILKIPLNDILSSLLYRAKESCAFQQGATIVYISWTHVSSR